MDQLALLAAYLDLNDDHDRRVADNLSLDNAAGELRQQCVADDD